MAALAAPAGALALAPAPSAPANNAAVGSRPTFSWTAGSVDGLLGIAGYEVVVELPAPAQPVVVATTGPGVLSATSTVDLPDTAPLRWYVRLTDTAAPVPGIQETPATARTYVRVTPPPPALAPPPATVTNLVPAFSWTGDRASSRWSVVDAAGAAVQGGVVTTASGQVRPSPLPTGTYQFQVVQKNVLGLESGPAAASFAIDATPPPALGVTASRPSPSVGVTPSFSWSGVEPGATSWWRVIAAGGVMAQGPTSTAGTSAAPAPLAAGSYSFEVRQVDAAGNPGPWTTEPFAILASPAAPPTAAVVAALPSSNWRKLTPKRGAVIRSTRPRLRWKAGPRGTRLYNVQIFLVGKNNALKKVRTAFPRTRTFTLSKRAALKKGSCYVWRVWPYRGSSFTSTPLGVSHFCIRK